MIVTVKKIIDSAQALEELSAEKNIKIKDAFRIAKLLNAIQTEMSSYNSARIAALEMYAVLDLKTNQYMFKSSEDEAEFKEQHEELIKETIEIAGDPIKLSVLSNASLSVGALTALEWMLHED